MSLPCNDYNCIQSSRHHGTRTDCFVNRTYFRIFFFSLCEKHFWRFVTSLKTNAVLTVCDELAVYSYPFFSCVRDESLCVLNDKRLKYHQSHHYSGSFECSLWVGHDKTYVPTFIQLCISTDRRRFNYNNRFFFYTINRHIIMNSILKYRSLWQHLIIHLAIVRMSVRNALKYSKRSNYCS